MIYTVQYGVLCISIVIMFFCLYRGNVFGNAPIEYLNKVTSGEITSWVYNYKFS